jgi:hypothetical protein
MILFFLPCLFIVILGPTYIKIQMMPCGDRRSCCCAVRRRQPWLAAARATLD